MAPTVGREGMVLSCDAHGDYLVQFEPSWEEKGPEGKGDAVEENEDEEKGSSSSVFKFGGEKRRLSVSFYYPPQALRLVSGGEPTKGARVRVRACSV